jgi:ABC-type transport system substrate-binding protein
MPEQPDPLTLTFKLKDGIKFQNGRTVIAQDVKYSWDRYSTENTSPARPALFWLDKVEAPDDKTVVFKAKTPWADAVVSFAPWQFGFILAKEFEESPDFDKKMLGSGPFEWVDWTPPVSLRLKKYQGYHDKPYPYVDDILFLGPVDPAKQVSDIASGQVDYTFGLTPALRNQVKSGRPDVGETTILFAPNFLNYRVDQKPLDDVRVRQALSMGLDRKKIREATNEGNGEDDQVLSYVLKQWGFRKPSQLKGAKNWKYDPAEAKKLLSAAGINSPMQFDLSSWDQTGAAGYYYDHATLTAAMWAENGLARVNQIALTRPQTTIAGQGNYNGAYMTPNSIANNPIIGLLVRANFFSNPDRTAPSPRPTSTTSSTASSATWSTSRRSS